MGTAMGAECIESLMKAELSQDVFAESSVPGLPSTMAQLQETMHGFHTPAKSKRIEAQRSTAAKRFSDIFPHPSKTTQSPILQVYPALLPRMTVESYDVTMVASLSDAVDTCLKKWRGVALQGLSMLATDTESGVNHPIYIATNATVKLYEAMFNTLLAQAN
jgi:hypothetical protein